MSVYEFKGVNKKGENVRGTIEADSPSVARLQIKKSGIYIVSIKDKSSVSRVFTSQKVDIHTLSTMTLNLSTMLKSGIPLLDALDTLTKQTENPHFKEILLKIKNSVNTGNTFHQSLASYPQVFNNTYQSMCKAGEASGTLDLVLFRLAQFTQAQKELRDKVRSALIYPCIMSVFSIGMVVFLLAYVVPKVRVLFEDMNQVTIPWYSLVLLDLSDFLNQYWKSILIGFVALIFFAWRWVKSPKGRQVWDKHSLNLPMFGKVIRSVAITRFTQTLSTLLNGGVPIMEALNIVKNVVNNQTLYDLIEQSKENISKGESLSATLTASPLFPVMVIQMIRVGEKTGQLEKMLKQIGDTYDRQVKSDVEAMTSLLEPVMLILMGGVIAFIVFSTMIPLLQMYNMEGLTAG